MIYGHESVLCLMQMLHAMKNFKFRIFIVHPQHLSFNNNTTWTLKTYAHPYVSVADEHKSKTMQVIAPMETWT